MMRLTQTIVLRTLLGADLGPFAGELDRAWALVNEGISERFWSLGLTDRWPPPRNRRFWRALAVLDGAVFHIIDAGRREPHENGDLLSMLMSARDEESGDAMTDRQLRDEVMTILLAGHETTSLALAWTWYLLSQNTAARDRLEAEVAPHRPANRCRRDLSSHRAVCRCRRRECRRRFLRCTPASAVAAATFRIRTASRCRRRAT
jgi:cytochrome P450